jgi:predicted short-subunit dehydrogenase-like oxidoreductase (DUF2520 family)
LPWYTQFENIEKSGSISSLTGPIARGDYGTIRKHLRTIDKNLPGILRYMLLWDYNRQIAQQKGTLNAGQQEKSTPF